MIECLIIAALSLAPMAGAAVVAAGLETFSQPKRPTKR